MSSREECSSQSHRPQTERPGRHLLSCRRLIANAISNPVQLVLTAQTPDCSVANVNSIVFGALESGFTQADVAYWAYSGTGFFDGKGKMEGLCLLANLYPESIHLMGAKLAAKSAGIKSVSDLRGKRVSLDAPGSGTHARIILGGWGIKESDVKTERSGGASPLASSWA